MSAECKVDKYPTYQERCLAQLRPGQSARIVSLREVPKAFRQRLLAMGITQGATLTLVRKAALGCPLEFQCGSTLVCLRQHEVALVHAAMILPELVL